MNRRSDSKVLAVRDKAVPITAILLVASPLTFLSIVAHQQAFSGLDLQISQWVRALHFPGLESIMGFANTLTSAQVAVTIWVIIMAFLVLRGRPLEAVAVFATCGLWIANEVLNILVARPLPSADINQVARFWRDSSFPSGHITQAVSVFGVLTFLTLKNVQRGHIRILVPALSVLIIGLASVGRVYVAAHWPSDVLGSYLLGSLGVIGIAWMYDRVRTGRFHIPQILRRRPAASTDGTGIARSIASTVYLDPDAGTATKEYNPPWPVKTLYRMAFQAPFPYQQRKEALEAAAAKRRIAGLLTKHRFGQDMVAAVYDIRNGGDNYRFVTEFIHGTPPASNQEVEGALSELTTYFQEVGLPIWQISPANPHSHSNFIRDTQGYLKLIDLESAIVSFGAPWNQLRAFVRDGHFPIFDDVDFVRLRRYVASCGSDLAGTLGTSGLEELNQAIETAELSSRIWKENEPRIWGRVVSRIYRLFDMSRWFKRIRNRLDNADSLARAFLQSTIDRWEQEGRIDEAQSASLRNAVTSPEVYGVLKHLGVHVVMSLALRFPFGSAARFAWVLSFWLKAHSDYVRGRTTREEYRAAKSLHSIPAMLISLIPGLGTVAYFSSGIMIRTGLARVLIDQFAYKLPFSLYHRLSLARITAPRITSPSSQTSRRWHTERSWDVTTGVIALVPSLRR
jgi:undecaprenyl-diphosphatase